MKRILLGATALASLAFAVAAEAAEKLKIGVTATLEGTYTVLGEDGMRGFELALRKWNRKAGGNAKIVGGSIMVDQTVLSSKGRAKEILKGAVAASGVADTWEDPRWQAFVKAYRDAFPPDKRFASPSLLAVNYYNSASATFTTLDKINGDLSDGHKKFRETMAKLELDAPNGKIRLDENRQAIGTNFVTEVVEDAQGNLVSKVVKVVENVNQTLGLPLDKFKAPGLPSRTNPECKKY